MGMEPSKKPTLVSADSKYAPPDEFAEKHYRVAELAELWGVSRETVRKLVMDDPGVVRIRQGRKKAHTIYIVSASVARRIYTRMKSGA